MARGEAVEGVVRGHENGIAVGEPEVDDRERSGRGDQKQRAGGREVVGDEKTGDRSCSLVNAGSVPVGHQVAGHRFLPEEMETGRRTACASDRRAWIRR